MRKGAPKLFHLGGHSSTNKKTSNAIPPKTHTHTHTHTEAADIHTGTNMPLVPRKMSGKASRSSLTALGSVNSSAAARKKIISHPTGSGHRG